jgi:hypothetical protein
VLAVLVALLGLVQLPQVVQILYFLQLLQQVAGAVLVIMAQVLTVALAVVVPHLVLQVLELLGKAMMAVKGLVQVFILVAVEAVLVVRVYLEHQVVMVEQV